MKTQIDKYLLPFWSIAIFCTQVLATHCLVYANLNDQIES